MDTDSNPQKYCANCYRSSESFNLLYCHYFNKLVSALDGYDCPNYIEKQEDNTNKEIYG